jgi:phosphoribosylformylglycinamidine synthase
MREPIPVERIARLRALDDAQRAERRQDVRVLVLTGLGLNCEVETEVAFRRAGASPERVHLLDVLDGSWGRRLADFSILAFVGGFSFGDHLGAGSVFANKIRWRLYDALVAFIDRGGLALGICNGFQTMVRLGMLPGLDGDYRTPRATLAPNDRLGYRDAWVRVAFEPESPCVWTRGLGTMELPSRHGEGKFLAESAELHERLEAGGQIAARYVDPSGEPTLAWPHNPSGSPHAVAGVCDPSGRLFGIMPHPDAYLYAFQHPSWWRRRAGAELSTGEDGRGIDLFRNGVDAAAAERLA